MQHDDLVALAKVRLEELLSFFGYNATAEVVETEDGVELQVPADYGGRLIGHHGETLRAIQHVLNMMIRHQSGRDSERTYISVDIAGYKQSRNKLLAEQGIAAADKAVSSGEEQVLRPMPASERRMVHMAISSREDVDTESRGEEPKRYIVVRPKSS
jgi:spoIIIJ-associated protein